eukprot:4733659-Prymnesium_polylepis.1
MAVLPRAAVLAPGLRSTAETAAAAAATTCASVMPVVKATGPLADGAARRGGPVLSVGPERGVL